MVVATLGQAQLILLKQLFQTLIFYSTYFDARENIDRYPQLYTIRVHCEHQKSAIFYYGTARIEGSCAVLCSAFGPCHDSV